MEKYEKEELIIEAASKVHEDWCNEELFAFFWRLQEFKNLKPGDAINSACYKNGKKRNDVVFDYGYIAGHELFMEERLFSDDFKKFKYIVGRCFDIKRFVKRNLTKSEIDRASFKGNYRDGEENILVPFKELSDDSKKENLEAAIGAFNVYEQMSFAGISLEEMKMDSYIREMIGVAIHADWLSRNMNHPNESLKVPYEQLDLWTQKQDLVVFDALLDIVIKNGEKYFVDMVEEYDLPDYEQKEREILGLSLIKK